MTTATARSGSLSPPPAARGHGEAGRPRRFSSRHVPSAAEELAQSQVTPEIQQRFNGLMRHLKPNTEREERQKQVMASSMEAMIPEEYDETLRREFDRRCAFGERLNTELMTSAKWVKLLREVGAIVPPVPERGAPVAGEGAIDLPEADIIFRKVLNSCDYGGRRLTYELFCKGLYLVAQSARPTLDGEAALVELLGRIISICVEEPQRPEDTADHMLDANVLLVLDHFKPALHDLFRTFCQRNLSNISDISHGIGTVRIRERTIWKHTQDTMLGSTCGAGGLMTGASRFGDAGASRATQDAQQLRQRVMAAGEGLPGEAWGSLEEEPDQGEDEQADCAGASANSEADAGGGYATPRSRDMYQAGLSPSLLEQRAGYPVLLGAAALASSAGTNSSPGAGASGLGSSGAGGTCDRDHVLAWAESRGWHSATQRLSTCSGTGTGTYAGRAASTTAQDPYIYANGAPIIRNRRHHMSVDQFTELCKELKIMPELISRQEVVKVFKRAQLAGLPTNHASSLYGYLSKESFVDAAGQAAIEAYSKEPFCDEYPAPHEKIHAFFLRVLPGSSREMHDRFLYGCGGRGR
mmetsp:Transcript_41314/g.86399  ORF Transcript_41314/g.86399 Transcript_41314/m.86399 type:complete len:582 (+) Transcript_41314:2-1747(+)